MKSPLLVSSFLIAASVATALATDFYVAKDGDDANSGLTRAQAKATITAGATDLMGRPRIVGKIVDIGCFEFETSRATRFMVR